MIDLKRQSWLFCWHFVGKIIATSQQRKTLRQQRLHNKKRGINKRNKLTKIH